MTPTPESKTAPNPANSIARGVQAEWQPISQTPPDGTVAVLYSAHRTYEGDGRLDDSREFGILCDIGVFYADSGWVEAYTGHDCAEEWRGDDVPTHWMPLPPAPEQHP